MTDAFNQRLQKFMDRYEISPDEMAQIFGTSPQTIYRWLKGVSAPEHRGMAHIALQSLENSYSLVNGEMEKIINETRENTDKSFQMLGREN